MSSTSMDCERAVSCKEERSDQENFMDTNNWRPTPPSAEPTMDSDDWRTTLKPDSRQRIVNKIMETLKRHLPFSGQEGLNELMKIAVRFEEKTFTAATSQSDYLRRISLKMLTMETKSQNTIPNTGNNSKPPFPGSQGMQDQVHSQGQSIPILSQQLLPQSVPNSTASAVVQSSAGLQSGVPFVSGPSQNPISNAVAQNSNMQNMSTMSIPHLSTDFSKLNIPEKPHAPTVNKANPNSLRSTVVTIVDEASTAVGEDLAAMRKQGLRAFTQTGMSGAIKIRCYLSVLVILALVICFIFKLNHQY